MGLDGYPPPRPRAEMKSRFTPEDDVLLKELKERFKLSWKQIADFFPDRKSGTLQVRYCTKIRKQDRVDWTDESVSLCSFTFVFFWW